MLLLLAPLALAGTSCDPIVTAVDEALLADAHCATTALMTGLERARDAGEARCFDEAMVRRGLPAAATGLLLPRSPLPPDGEVTDGKLVRDALVDPYPYQYETDNFAVKWGSYARFSEENVHALADAFERAWAEEVVGWGFEAPRESDKYKFNVYIGDTDGGTPSSMGAAGYYYYDGDGWPMIVIAASQVRDEDSAASTAAHEFFHALQGQIGGYQYQGQGAWYFESTAVWAEEQVYPEHVSASGFVVSFAYLPEYPLNFFDYPDTGTLAELYQYGSFVFPRFLSDRYGGEFIKRSWEEAPLRGDPLVVIGGLLEEEGTDLAATFFDFAAHNATWDYPLGENYRYWIDQWGGLSGGGSHAPSGTFRGVDESWRSPDEPPHTFGTNYWMISKPFVQTGLELEVEDPSVQWSLTLVERTGDEHVRTDIPVVDGRAAAELGDLSGRDELWLVVSAVASPVDRGLGYDYRLRLYEQYEEPEQPVQEVEEPKGCATAPAGALGLWLLPLLGYRRRRDAP
ncbi:MAG: hypothetical protein JXX28_15035 [Deltaproteobacteria bacterium]|nr:hypothetical protein [Deltaproteobacteria bacterium]